MKSIYKKILSIGLLSAFLEFALARPAHAGLFTIDGLTSGVITLVSQVILGIFTFFAQGFFIIAGFFVELAMKMNNSILDPAQNVFLFKGWTVFVNVADLALVVALIIIAFATMLSYESYGMKKTLPKLIIVALLVNFSLVIPGVLVDLSGMVTAFFVEQAGLNGSGMSNSLASAFNISSFMSTANLNSGAGAGQIAGLTAGKLGSGIMNILMNMTFIVVFTAVATVIMLTLAVMLFLRYFMLSFLLLMSPVIFVAWIFPGTKKHWTDWWNKFIRWTMFPPVMIFFMWLSLTALNATSAVTGTTTGSAGDIAQKLMNFNLSSLINMAMAVMLMILSLIAANSISISGAKGGNDMISGVTTWGRGKIDKMGKSSAAYGKREGERAGRRAIARPVAAVGRGAESLRKYEGAKGGALGYAAGKLGRAGERVSTAQQASLKKAYEDKFKGMSEDNLANRYSTMGTDEKVFAAQQLSAKGKINKVNEKILDSDIADKNAKATIDKYGGEGTYDKITKAAGRNADMVNAKAKQPEIDAKVRDVEAKIAAISAPGAGGSSQERNTRLNELQKEKDNLAKGSYDKIAKDFYSSFGRKDFESLGSKFYSEGRYGDEALKGLLIKEPSAFGKIMSGLEKRDDAEKFNDKAIKIIESMKREALEVVKAKQGPAIASETDREMLSVMKGIQNYNETDARAMNLGQKMEWVKENDARVHAALGGEKLADNLEQQMKFLQARKNSVVLGMGEVEDYQKSIRTQESMRKSMGKRLYAESEKKEEKPA